MYSYSTAIYSKFHKHNIWQALYNSLQTAYWQLSYSVSFLALFVSVTCIVTMAYFHWKNLCKGWVCSRKLLRISRSTIEELTRIWIYYMKIRFNFFSSSNIPTAIKLRKMSGHVTKHTCEI
jgi:hypothetical protein